MMEFFEGPLWIQWGWLFIVGLVLVCTALAKVLIHRILRRIRSGTETTKTPWDDALFNSINRPIYWTVWLIGISIAVSITYTSNIAETQDVFYEYLDKFRSASIILLFTWFAIRFIREFQKIVVEHKRKDGKVSRWDPETARIVCRVLDVTVTLLTVLMIMQTFEVQITGLLAFGGISGIAVGFAAQGLLANFFGALLLFFDKPFGPGDWIRSPDKSIEGTVEHIGWRMTKIRTFDQRPLYVPNSTFTTITVENPSRMLNRRFYEIFGLRYEDIGVAAKVIDEVRDMLLNHPAIDTTKTLMVNLIELDDSSVNFFVYTFTKTTVWTEFHEIKQELLLKITDIVVNHGADFAFPTRTLHIEHDQLPPHLTR